MRVSSDFVAHELLDVVPVIMRTIRSEMRSRRSADLTVPQFRTLLFLHRNPGAPLLAVAEHVGLTPPTVSKMVDGMVSHALVGREISSTDRRKITLTLTPDGQAILKKARRGTQARLAELLASLSPAERELVFQAMQLLHPLFSPAAVRKA